MKVRCPSCFREESWSPDGVRTVHVEGGQRRPVVHPELAAWATIRTARQQGCVVGPCICGQPLVATSGDWHTWTLTLPTGEVTVEADQQTGPSGPLTDEALQKALDDAYRERLEITPKNVALGMFRSTLFLSLLAPFILWVLAATTVVLILMGLVQPVGFG